MNAFIFGSAIEMIAGLASALALFAAMGLSTICGANKGQKIGSQPIHRHP
jgi:hypothetical protein